MTWRTWRRCASNPPLRSRRQPLRLNLHRPARAEAERVHLKIVKLGEPVPISDLLPMLENFGLRVISERPYELAWPEGGTAWIQDFEVEHRDRLPVEIAKVEADFSDAFLAAWRGEVENDGFNRLLLGGGAQSPRDRGAARLLPLPAADRRALQPGVHGTNAGGQSRHRPQSRPPVRKALRPRRGRRPHRGAQTRRRSKLVPSATADKLIARSAVSTVRASTKTASCAAT